MILLNVITDVLIIESEVAKNTSKNIKSNSLEKLPFKYSNRLVVTMMYTAYFFFFTNELSIYFRWSYILYFIPTSSLIPEFSNFQINKTLLIVPLSNVDNLEIRNSNSSDIEPS